ncbi:tetratricopeptide repeat protein [Roseivirga misakiensis]|uniref:Uncharacterized protein n=1 Tax=Roseivirga misakiensis TaxID=1563681 RepID=A0A1E5T5L8_9BACT|nr:hypothetical protein [Roseivirga misakiensis]OEK06684.1 hypothetical protein BFP71_03195 [Roseivirga misakiensis]
MNEKIDIRLLEKFKNGEISSERVLNYDGMPVSEEELKIALEDFENLTIQLKALDLEKSFKSIHLQVANKTSRNFRLKLWSAAATLVLLVSFSYLLLKPSQPNFIDYFNHFDQYVTLRESDSTDYSVGLEAYSIRDYNKAYVALEQIDSLNNELKFYLAISALGSSRSIEAVQILEELNKDSLNKYYQQIKWYLGLAYWQVGDVNSAIEILNQIEVSEFKYADSRKLINALQD